MKIKDLRLSLSAAPKKNDIRDYLNGLNITKTHVTGSKGHVLCHINTYQNDIPEGHDNIIVPTDTIKALLRKIWSKHENTEVAIFLVNEQYQLQCMNQLEVFEPIDHKYPDFKKHLDSVKANDHNASLNHQFDWGYVADANKAICKHTDITTPNRLYCTDQVGYFMPSDEVIYIIMPCAL